MRSKTITIMLAGIFLMGILVTGAIITNYDISIDVPQPYKGILINYYGISGSPVIEPYTCKNGKCHVTLSVDTEKEISNKWGDRIITKRKSWSVNVARRKCIEWNEWGRCIGDEPKTKNELRIEVGELFSTELINDAIRIDRVDDVEVIEDGYGDVTLT